MKKIQNLILASAAATLLLTGCAEDYKSDFNPAKPDGLEMNEFLNRFDVLKSYTGLCLATNMDKTTAEAQNTAFGQVVSNFNEVVLTNAFDHSVVVNNAGEIDAISSEKAVGYIADKNVKIFGSTLCSPTTFNLSYMKEVVSDTYVPGSEGEDDFDLENFEGMELGTKIPGSAGNAEVVEDPDGLNGHCIHYTQGFNHPFVDITLPSGVSLGQIKKLFFDYRTYGGGWIVTNVCKVVVDGTTIEVSPKSAKDQGVVANTWGKMTVDFEDLGIIDKLNTSQKAAKSFKIGIGEIVSAPNYYIDNVRVHASFNNPGYYEPRPAEEKKADAIKVMTDYINGVVGIVGDKADGWIIASDALNAGTEMDVLKNSETSYDAETEFYMNDYLGDNFVADLAKIAHSANPDLKLFYSDYDLENDEIKLDNCCEMLKQWNENGAQLAGIDAQIHLIYNPSDMEYIKANYENMLQKLAATGLQVRLSGLDMTATDENGFSLKMDDLTDDQLKGMADFYSYVVSKYQEIVPTAQQYGLSFSPINQNASNIGLWSDYNRLPTYVGVANGLKSTVTKW